MDLHTISAYAVARDRSDLVVGPDTAFVAGGTWMFSEPQTHLRGLIDLSALGWPDLAVTGDGLEIAATCTVERLAAISDTESWTAASLFRECATALLASWKVWKRATVGGNVCLSFPAGAMISLATALDASALVWSPDGTERRIPMRDFVTGIGANLLGDGEVLRSLHVPASALRSRTAFRKIALSPLGRSGAVVIGRDAPDGAFTLSVTAATTRPYLLGFASRPDAGAVVDALDAQIPDAAYHTDAHGRADWRRAVTAVLAREICDELSIRADRPTGQETP